MIIIFICVILCLPTNKHWINTYTVKNKVWKVWQENITRCLPSFQSFHTQKYMLHARLKMHAFSNILFTVCITAYMFGLNMSKIFISELFLFRIRKLCYCVLKIIVYWYFYEMHAFYYKVKFSWFNRLMDYTFSLMCFLIYSIRFI